MAAATVSDMWHLITAEARKNSAWCECQYVQSCCDTVSSSLNQTPQRLIALVVPERIHGNTRRNNIVLPDSLAVSKPGSPTTLGLLRLISFDYDERDPTHWAIKFKRAAVIPLLANPSHCHDAIAVVQRHSQRTSCSLSVRYFTSPPPRLCNP